MSSDDLSDRLQNAPPHEHPEHPNFEKRHKNLSKLKIAFGICCLILVIELVGAYISGSLALLADAFHMLTDALSLGIALMAAYFANRLRSEEETTYGYYRLEVLAAFTNGVLLIFMAGYIFLESFNRILFPTSVDAFVMLSIGSLGLLANLFMVFVLHGSHTQNLNIKGAFFHVVGDTIASVAVVIGALCIWIFKTSAPDVIVSMIVSLIIASMAIKLLKESGHVLMEGTPLGIRASDVEKRLKDHFPQIRDIHDFHYWQITSNLYAMTAHVSAVVQNHDETRKLIDAMNEVIKTNYGITHTTFQIEPMSDNETSNLDK